MSLDPYDHVPADRAETFADADDPDVGFRAWNLVQGLYWSLRGPLERLRRLVTARY